MKPRWIVVALVAIIAAGGLIFAFLEMSKERAIEREREKPVAAEPQVKRGTNGEVTITLDADTQKRIGLKIEALAPKQIRREIKGYGRVLDPAPLAMLASDLASARVTAEASGQEFERLKTLAGQNNTSARALQGAEAAARRDEVQREAVAQQLLATWGKAIAERSNLADFIQSLALRQSALIRIDLLP